MMRSHRLFTLSLVATLGLTPIALAQTAPAPAQPSIEINQNALQSLSKDGGVSSSSSATGTLSPASPVTSPEGSRMTTITPGKPRLVWVKGPEGKIVEMKPDPKPKKKRKKPAPKPVEPKEEVKKEEPVKEAKPDPKAAPVAPVEVEEPKAPEAPATPATPAAPAAPSALPSVPPAPVMPGATPAAPPAPPAGPAAAAPAAPSMPSTPPAPPSMPTAPAAPAGATPPPPPPAAPAGAGAPPAPPAMPAAPAAPAAAQTVPAVPVAAQSTPPATAAAAPATPSAPAAPAAAKATDGKKPDLTIEMKPTETTMPLTVKENMDKLVAQLKADETQRVNIVAYASAAADQASTARRVSLSRALSVRAYLIDNGVNNLRINVQAEGDKNPGGAADRVDLFVTK